MRPTLIHGGGCSLSFGRMNEVFTVVHVDVGSKLPIACIADTWEDKAIIGYFGINISRANVNIGMCGRKLLQSRVRRHDCYDVNLLNSPLCGLGK
eukprot:scaffold1485_cov171-Amphora_coffeaeformis.AAC.29